MIRQYHVTPLIYIWQKIVSPIIRTIQQIVCVE
jgi:hypothetical protein